MKKTIKISEELDFILSIAADYAKQVKCSRLTLETVVFIIIKSYTDENISLSKLESKTLATKLRENKDINEIILRCSEFAVEENSKYLIKDENISKLINFDSLVLSEKLDNAFNNAQKDLLSLGISENKEKISTLNLFCSCLNETDSKLIRTLINTYGIKRTDFLGESLIKSSIDNSNNSNDFRFSDFVNGITNMFDSFRSRNLPTPDSMINQKLEETEDDIKKHDDEFEKAGNIGDKAISTREINKDSKTPTLDEFSTDMTEKAIYDEYDPVIGRDKEISRICEILCCRKKNNAILLGDPGAGKTAVVELLAQKIVNKEVPEQLLGKRILSLSTTDLTAGTIYRGQLEERLRNICKELAESKDIIVYMDEFHTATSENSTSIADLLKPSLGRGEITLIASTTIDEYRKFIEKDGALDRRFNSVLIEEPDTNETVEILKGLEDKYSKFHRVRYKEGVMEKIAEWSGRYISDKHFPDKAISILDMVSSYKKLGIKIDKSKLNKLENQLKELQETKKNLVEEDNIEEADKIRKSTNRLKKKLEKEKENIENPKPESWPEVDELDVSKIISKTSGVPVDKIVSSDMAKLKEIKTKFQSKVIGQDEAVDQLTLSLQRNMLGLRDPKRPIASFLFLGPTGVGKTHISQILAEEFFGSDKNLITIACSEYTQDFSESKLIGASSGYIGYNDEPRLYVLKRKPYSVLLIDEVEKASENLQNLFLNILEEGQVTLSSGEVISCKNCIVIFTGNVGTKSLELYGKGMGFETATTPEEKLKKEKKNNMDIVMKEVNKTFRPEFINRLSKIIIFNSLGKEEMNKIFYIELEKLQKRLKENNNYNLEVTEKLKDLIVSKCEPQYGARSLKRLLVEYVEQELCKAMLDSDTEGKYNIVVDLNEDNTVNVVFK